MRVLLPTLALSLMLAASGRAWAECTQPYLGDQLVNDLQVMQVALRNLDEATFEIGRAHV